MGTCVTKSVKRLVYFIRKLSYALTGILGGAVSHISRSSS
jgi:hypothetical protein